MHNVYLFQPNYKGGYGKFSSFWFPYSIGSLWAYAQTHEVIRENYLLKDLLFERLEVDDVIRGMESPVVVGFSNYIWNVNYNKALAAAIKQKWPDTTVVFGGPEVPDRLGSFFENNPFVDIAVHHEGEITFTEILAERLKPKFDPGLIHGISYVDSQKKVIRTPPRARIQNLEELPSPYLSGVFDNLIRNNDVQWAATYETNRGCPFKCHFCDWGSLTFSKIKKFPDNRAIKELEWFGEHKVEYIFIADANFGAFKKRDFEIADRLVDVYEQTGYPKSVNIQWAKNSNRDVAKLAKKLASVQKGMTLSVQSMTEEVLEAIERKNMAIDNLSDILEECNKENIATYTELILGLPLETFESWQKSWHKLLDLGQHCSIELWITQLLENSQLNHPAERSRFGIKTIKAKNYFFGISDTADPAETRISEEIALITETNTMPFESMIDSYLYGWMIINFHLMGWTQVYSRFLNKFENQSYGEFYSDLFDFIRGKDGNSLVNAEYRATKERITIYLTGGDIEINLKDEIGLDQKFVGHNLLHATQMVIRYNFAKSFHELECFILKKTAHLPEDLRSSLVEAQKHCLVAHDVEYPYPFQMEWNIFGYVFSDEELQVGKREYIVDYKKEIRDTVQDIGNLNMSDYLDMFWYKRRQGVGLTAITSLS